MKYVRHMKKDEWGIGKVLSVNEHKIEIDFINCGVKLLNSKIAILEEVLDEGEIGKFKEDKLLTSLTNKKSKKNTFNESISLEELINVFHNTYPGGFYDEKYIEEERKNKETISNEFINIFSADNLLEKIKEGRHKEICEISKKLISATKIIHSIEKTNFRKAISLEENQKEFVEVLYRFLYNQEALGEKDFFEFKEFFSKISCNKWTLLTYFMNMILPNKYPFLKPKVSKKAAEVFGFDLNYNMIPNWQTYNSFLTYTQKLMKDLEELKPRDYIDIENFIWVTIKTL